MPIKGGNMNNGQNEQQFNQQLQVMQILNGALLASVGLLGVVGTISPNGAPENFPFDSKLFIVFAGIMAVLSFVLPMVILKNTVKTKKDLGLQDLFTSFILSLALSECVGIFGLIAKIHAGDVTVFWILLAASAGLVAIRFPTRDRVLGMLAALRAGH